MKTADIPVIELNGTPRERGRIYGETAKHLIANVVEAWRADLGSFGQNSATENANTNTIDPDVYLSEFFLQTHFLNSIEKWTPDLLEEVKGIAEGAEQTFSNILGLQLMDEEWIFGLRRRLNKPTTKCTAFGVPNQENGISYAGQNMDIPSWIEGAQVLLRVMPTDVSPEALVFSFAGSIGLNGLNAGGLGITCNTLPQLNYSIHGLPVLFIVRSILQCQNIENAEQFLRSIQHASGQNFILSSLDDMQCFECCGTSIARYAPKELNGRVMHSNHPLTNNDKSDLSELTRGRRENSEARLASIYERLGNMSRSMTLDDIKAALAAHDDPDNPVSRRINPANVGNSIGYTAGSSIYEFSDVPRLHLAAGPPCETAFDVFEFITSTRQSIEY